ncbi:unnamed protein product [Calicophoron daubneyi]|uniref:Dual serine/threonine and tyrosine protein kinase n=1 Tax=Calicophoron daubneyi TaxID=300641 RepID=A0AAV2TLI9_CALDB
MTALIGKEVRRFKKHRLIIRKNLKDLRKAYQCIEEDELNERFLRAAGVDYQLSIEDEQLCSQVAENDVAIIILGQDNYAKAAVVNELFQKDLLPIKSADENSLWRLINIHNGQQNSASLCIKETLSTLDEHMPVNIEKYINDDPLVDENASRDNCRKSSFLDISLNGELLLVDGLRVIVAPSCRNNTVDEFCEVFQTACSGVLPLLIYAFQCKALTSWDLIKLTELRRLAHENPILFVTVPPKEMYYVQVKGWQHRLYPCPRHLRNLTYLDRGHRVGQNSLQAWYKRNPSSSRKETTFLRHRWSISRLPDKLAPLGQAQRNMIPEPGDQSGLCCDTTGSKPREEALSSAEQAFKKTQEVSSLEHAAESEGELSKFDFQTKLLSILVQLGFISGKKASKMKQEEEIVDTRSVSADSGLYSTTDSNAQRTEYTAASSGSSTASVGSLPMTATPPAKTIQAFKLNRVSTVRSEIVHNFQKDFEGQLFSFIQRRLQNYLFWSLESINSSVIRCLQGFVLQAYDLAHDLSVTPKRLEFAKAQELKLYEKLLKKVRQSQPAIMDIMSNTLKEMCSILPQRAAHDLDFSHISGTEPNRATPPSVYGEPLPPEDSASLPIIHQNDDVAPLSREAQSHSTMVRIVNLSTTTVNSAQTTDGVSRNPRTSTAFRDYKQAVKIVRGYIIQKVTNAIAARVLESMEVMRQSCVGTLKRTIFSLEQLDDNELYSNRALSCPLIDCCTEYDDMPLGFSPTSNDLDSADVAVLSQKTPEVRSMPHSPMAQEISFFPSEDALTEGHCSAEHADPDSKTVSSAFKDLLRFAYALSIPAQTNAVWHITGVFEKLKEAFINPLSWKVPAELDPAWTEKTARAILNTLCESSIARKLCAQVTEKLRQSHEGFLLTLQRLEARAELRHCRFEEAQESILRHHAPRLSRIALDTSAMQNYLLHGLPFLGKEIGRGQYGVVYACSRWGSYSHLAVKSVVPPDDKHWKDLALEVYYSRQIPPHERIVRLHATVIDYDHAHGSQPAVLIIMERLVRDLHTAIKQGLPWPRRLNVARDVVEGMRYLHSLGLVHRDIKPRNVLLDHNDRAKLTDLGFCKPYAMIGGSILGTPMHMAPEIFEQNYDYAVDIYAFGVLFWYICAGRVQMPKNFEQCADKEALWQAVRRGEM